MVDEKTGDHLEKQLLDREEHEYSVALFTSEGVPYFAGRAIDNSEKDFDTLQGGATVVRWILKQAWIPSGRCEPPSNFDVPDHLIQRLELFLKGELERRTWLSFMPRFEFVDARGINRPQS